MSKLPASEKAQYSDRDELNDFPTGTAGSSGVIPKDRRWNPSCSELNAYNRTMSLTGDTNDKILSGVLDRIRNVNSRAFLNQDTNGCIYQSALSAPLPLSNSGIREPASMTNSLSYRILREPLSLKTALEIALQITAGVSMAGSGETSNSNELLSSEMGSDWNGMSGPKQ